MARDTATDKELAILHKKVASAMLRALDSCEQAQQLLDDTYYDEDENELVIPEPIKLFLEKQVQASPSLLTAITKFLKDNDVTCQVDDSKEMSELEQRLQNKQTRKAVGNVIPIADDE